MESTLRRVTVASRQFPIISSLRVHATQGPCSRRQTISSKAKAKKAGPKIEPILKTFHRDDKTPRPETPGLALFDMRKRLARVTSHGGNVIDHLLKEFGLQPLTGTWVLKDDQPAGGAWVVTNPRKGHIKFVHDDYDDFGRLRATKPDPMPTVIRDSGIYAELLANANRFVAAVCGEHGLKEGPVLSDPEEERAGARARARPRTRDEKVAELRVKRGKERDKAKREAERAEAEKRRQEKRPPVIPDLARTRFREWQRRKREKIREVPSLTYLERHTMIETTRDLLKEVVATRLVKPGWLECLEVRLYEKDV